MRNYHRPVCVKCEVEMRLEKNGFGVVDMVKFDGEDIEYPYAVWDADKWKCRKCGAEVVIGFAHNPVARHHEEGFVKVLAGYHKTGYVASRDAI